MAQQHFNSPESEPSCQAYDKPNAGNPQESPESEDFGESDASEVVCSRSRMIVHYYVYELAGFTGCQRPQRLSRLWRIDSHRTLLNTPKAPYLDLKTHHSFKNNRHYRHSLIELPLKQGFSAMLPQNLNFLYKPAFASFQFSDVPLDFILGHQLQPGKFSREKNEARRKLQQSVDHITMETSRPEVE
jgi:hypothetical protein